MSFIFPANTWTRAMLVLSRPSTLSLLSEQRSFDGCHQMLDVKAEVPSNPSSPEAAQRDRCVCLSVLCLVFCKVKPYRSLVPSDEMTWFYLSDRIVMKKDSSKISRSTSSTCTFTVATDDVHQVSRNVSFPQTLCANGKLLTQPLSTLLAGHGCRRSKCSGGMSQSHRSVSCTKDYLATFYIHSACFMFPVFVPCIRTEE